MELLPFRFGNRLLSLGGRPLVMGILNVTPDSFSDGGRFADSRRATDRALEMVAEGADFLDIGGESTRPGADPVSPAEEEARVVPVIRALREQTDTPISIDTTKASVAAAALEAGADIVNDVSALERDPSMAGVLKRHRAGCILMHMRGTPDTMQSLTEYGDLIGDIRAALAEALARAVAGSGLSPEYFMLDPGIGFAKAAERNPELIAGIGRFRDLGRPVLMGPSRKSFIGKILNRPDPGDREWGTAGAVAACVLFGADVIRVHAVRGMRDAALVAAAVRDAAERANTGAPRG